MQYDVPCNPFLLSSRLGFDQVTDSDVVMKFVPPGEMIEFLEVEYHNYLLLGAKGRFHVSLNHK